MSSTVDRALAAALYTADADLDTAASLLAADPSADLELATRGREFVRRAWERGWQPADVIRMAVRDESLAPEHVRLAARLIREELERYEALPPRWTAQLAALPGDDPARQDRFSAATTTLELYRLLARLPAVEAVGPVPGEALTAPVAGEPRALARIRALLAKAEATGYPPEAEALTAKAQELMARHSVDEALLAARTHAKEAPAACRIGVDAPYETAKAVLLDAVATANRCRAVWNSAFGFSTVVGFEPDLEVVELLYTSLLVQADAAMTRAEARQRAGGRKRTKTFRQSFLAAYAHRVGARLAEVAGEAAAGGGGEGAEDAEVLPVLAARDVAVAGRTEEMFPETVATRVRGVSDGAGWDEGTAAAQRARLTGP
ncbi:DUF2786 domain-containing protein [Streptomyces beihaiensis]|uniref:DUF2786 domain-containing protein n=1 Tax=Streptomyces beihaiensis TaxID=2984495 RepID=A0ABT3TVX3_9ACTN|nr:DUF2786 domain-containing protein [Streptomyces beihaiensis]MCX3061169.1 DUF2786 domain-containing protein [Streptomyces beihaiensis]